MSNSCTTPTSYVTTPDYLIASCHLITIISFPIHVIGLYIILFKTPKAMSSIKWYFVNLHGWIVLYDNTMGVLFIPYLLLPSLSGFPLGLLAHIVDEFYMVVSLLTFCAYMQLSILALFENRFYIICEFSWKVYWEKVRRPWIVAHYIYTVVVFIPMAYMLPDQEVAKEQVLKVGTLNFQNTVIFP
uniref:Serpentine receptor class gamma n=1 Tax=Caenorhabditis tropicalis TaxID=1561998 RepID=A0A1I7U9R6_9PELO